ncbi:DUF2125 domain-containing protein [Rhodopila sp.]|uniref:DUF2125 domain-containing protein n=1 Tax=Rhodopila sp. TaxID=2480087 RepID=UPI003D13C79A
MAVIASLLLGADLVYWRIASVRLRDELRTWIAARRAEGWDVESGAVSTGGWPRAAAVTVPALTLRHAGQDMPGTISWTAAEVGLSLPLYYPSKLRIALTGPQHIRIGDAPDVIVTGDTIAFSVGLLSEQTLPLTLHAQGLRVEPAAGGWHLTVGLLNADAEVAPAAGRSQPLLAFSVSTEAVALPANVRWPLGPNISSLSTEGALNGPLPQVHDMTRWAETWRDGGGSLEISHLALGWGPLGLTAKATLALDDQLQPTGSGGAHLVGYAEALDKMASAGVMSRSAATAARAVLSLMAGSGAADESPAVDVPLTLQYRTLSMRHVPLLRLPALDWPAR